ncbi:MAG: response regulator transcription factor [Clostridiales bacterium]|nr:response regulator transcription factor [Clostridiales bacterium]
MSKILVVDDEKLIVKGIKFSLMQDDMDVSVAYDGEEALRLARTEDFDLILLDVMLPKINGLDVCSAIREFSSVPIIMVTAKGEDIDKIMGLELGADDYITKPFNILELKARIKAILRRSVKKTAKTPVNDSILTLRELSIDTKSRRCYVEGKEVNLTAKEFELLMLLMKNIGTVYSREDLLSEIWHTTLKGSGEQKKEQRRAVDVHVRRLREKIEKVPREPQYIHTRWGVGYYLQ